MNISINWGVCRVLLHPAIVSSCLLLALNTLANDTASETKETAIYLQPPVEFSGQVIRLAVDQLLPEECDAEDQCFFTINPDSPNGTLLVVYNPDSKQHYVAKWRDDSPVQTPIASSFDIVELVDCTHCIGFLEIEGFEFGFLMDSRSEFAILPSEFDIKSEKIGMITAYASELKDSQSKLKPLASSE